MKVKRYGTKHICAVKDNYPQAASEFNDEVNSYLDLLFSEADGLQITIKDIKYSSVVEENSVAFSALIIEEWEEDEEEAK